MNGGVIGREDFSKSGLWTPTDVLLNNNQIRYDEKLENGFYATSEWSVFDGSTGVVDFAPIVCKSIWLSKTSTSVPYSGMYRQYFDFSNRVFSFFLYIDDAATWGNLSKIAVLLYTESNWRVFDLTNLPSPGNWHKVEWDVDSYTAQSATPPTLTSLKVEFRLYSTANNVTIASNKVFFCQLASRVKGA